MTRPDLHIFSDHDALFDAAADHVAAEAARCMASQGRFTVALSGGTTPRPLFSRLGASPRSAQIDWSRVHVFWSDERCVPPHDAQSNFRVAWEALLSRVPVPPGHVHRMEGEVAPEVGAARYELALRAVFGAEGPPRFDHLMLGMGADAHTASLFPGSAALSEGQRWVVAVSGGAPVPWRLTLTPPVIAAASEVSFIITGADKAAPLRQVLEGERAPQRWPAQVARQARGRQVFWLDAAAAAALA
ncbi:MAG TPA: 6-phosphogluconolactonase [Myxococcota bacterium]|nr:6-phosphogluconolactonase [Myxococcota bacterium]